MRERGRSEGKLSLVGVWKLKPCSRSKVVLELNRYEFLNFAKLLNRDSIPIFFWFSSNWKMKLFIALFLASTSLKILARDVFAFWRSVDSSEALRTASVSKVTGPPEFTKSTRSCWLSPEMELESNRAGASSVLPPVR